VVAAAPARAVTAPPTVLLRCLTPVGDPLPCVHTRGKSAGFRRGVMSPKGSTPVRPITGRPSLAPSSFTRSPVGSPRGSLSLAGGLRAYHVAPRKPRGLGPASTPVVRHPRGVSSEHANLATYLLVQAYQHLGLVLDDGAYGGSPGLALPRLPGPRPPRCWQSQSGLTPSLPSRRMRIRCAEGFAPPGCPGRTPR
jgi:hypothetical protein